MDRILNWFKNHLSDPQVVFLALAVVGVLFVVSYAGTMMAPVIAAVVVAYLLDGLITRMLRRGVPRMMAIWLVFLGFLFLLTGITFGLFPILYNQLTGVVQQIPNILASGQATLMTLPSNYPDLISIEQVEALIAGLREGLTDYGQNLVTNILTGAASVVTLLIYMILLPILIFFFLKDKYLITGWIKDLLPKENQLTLSIWGEVDVQIANYIRGKIWEILIVWGVTFTAFALLGLEFAMLLSFLVGLSVLVPYVGAAVVTIPVVLIAWFQWGWGSDFITLVVAYLVIQALDGNLLVPLLFSEVVNIHPVAIIVAVLFFGGLWGIWGIFFAIPLATLVHAIILSWPTDPRAEGGP
ncbi:MAG: AI-2E family transporter [Gammaproteobacteria bacterium]|nr:AI-2E family transporter [Gammaproteobacteria bacterium]